MNSLSLWWHSQSLGSQSPETRRRAVETLTRSRDPKAAELLGQALSDPDGEIRSAAACALATRRDRTGIEPLIGRLLCEHDQEVLHTLVTCLRALDDGSAEALLTEALEDPDVSVRQCAAIALRRLIGDQLDDARGAQISIINANWDEVACRGKGAIAPLVSALTTGTARMKREAAEALAHIGNKESVGALVSAVVLPTGTDATVQEAAAWALEKFNWKELDVGQRAVVAIARGHWSKLQECGVSAIPAVRVAIRSVDLKGRLRMAEFLETLAQEQEAAELLGEIVHDRDQELEVREAAALSLGHCAAGCVQEALRFALDDVVWRVRVAAARALTRLAWVPPTTEDRIRLALASSDWATLRAQGSASAPMLLNALRFPSAAREAGRILARLPGGVEALRGVLVDPRQDLDMRAAASEALVEIKDSEALQHLESMLRDGDWTVRQIAAGALKRLDYHPADDAQRALLALAREDWSELRRLGGAAVEPLLWLVRQPAARREGLTTLQQLLEASAKRLTIGQLRAVVTLGAPAAGTSRPLNGMGNLRHTPMPPSPQAPVAWGRSLKSATKPVDQRLSPPTSKGSGNAGWNACKSTNAPTVQLPDEYETARQLARRELQRRGITA